MSTRVVKQVDFAFNIDDTYEVALTEGNAAVFKDGVWQTDFPVPFTNAQLSRVTWTQSVDTLILFHPQVQTQKITRITDADWDVEPLVYEFIPKYDYVPATENPAFTMTPDGTEGEVKLTLSSADWDATDLHQRVTGNGGLARIVQINSTTEAVAEVVIPFFNDDAIASGDWEKQTGFVDAWSDTRGWPSVGTFHGGRMYVGSGPLPNRVWGSKVGFFFDFDPGQGLDDSAVEGAIDTDDYVQITALFSSDRLQVYTTSGEFIVDANIITPNNFIFKGTTRRGMKPDIPVVELDSATLFVQRGGKAIREFFFEDVQQAYTAEPLTLLSSHLIVDPIDFRKRKATNTEDADILLVVNTDGTLATCITMRTQKIVAWTLQTTRAGNFKSCGVDDQDMLVSVERVIDEIEYIFLEKFNDDHYMDASHREVLADGNLPEDDFVLDWLPNTVVEVRADESVLSNETTSAAGALTADREAEAVIEIGLDFPDFTDTDDITYTTPLFISLPIEPELEEGLPIGLKKRVVDVTLDLLNTSACYVNNNRVVFRGFGLAGSGSPLDSPPPTFTGKKRVEGLHGHEVEARVWIESREPAPMIVLAASAKVSV